VKKGHKSFLTAIKEAEAPKAENVSQETAPAPVEQKEVQPARPPTAQPLGLAERLAQARAASPISRAPLGAAPQPPTPPASTSAVEDTLAALPDQQLVLSAEEQILDAEIAGLNIIEVYNRWCGKMRIGPTSQRESIKISCPNPQHPDKHPSAWLNQDKGTWYCPGCGFGGDAWDIFAWHHGYTVPGYKEDKAFRELRERVAGDLGYKKYTTSAGSVLSRTPPVVEEQEIPNVGDVPGDSPDESEAAPEGEVEPPSNVVQLHIVQDEEYAAAVGPEVPSIDWKKLVTPGSFLEAWMIETTKDTCPEEYHFWTGLMALGFAVGRHRVLLDNPKVTGNLFVCLTGPSGTGKSRAKAHLKNVISEALPFRADDLMPMGTKLGGSPGSGEVLIDTFGHKIEDVSLPKAQWADWPLRVYVEFEEMAGLVARGARAGSSLKSTLMDIYDAPRHLSISSRMHGTSSAALPFGQVMTTTQNKSIREVVNRADEAAGFINRWVFVTGPRKTQRAINMHVTDYTEPVAKLKGVHNWASTGRDVNFTPEALEAFEEFYKQVFAMKDKAEEESAIFNRIDLLLKKIVLLFAVNDRSNTVQLDHVHMMSGLYPYLLRAYGVVQGAMSSTEDREIEIKISGAVRRYYDRKKEALTVGAVARYVKGVESKDMVRVIDNMVKLGYLMEEEAPGGKRGRPSRKLLPGVAVA
jgi:hypothetical protein